MKYLKIIILELFVLFLVSCNNDDDVVVSETKRITKIERLNAWGEYKLFSYNSDGNLSSIEEGDEKGMRQRILITYEGSKVITLQLFSPDLSSSVNLRYKNDSIFIVGFQNFRKGDHSYGKVNDTLIINPISNTLLKITDRFSTERTYTYDYRGNVISTSYMSKDYIDYDKNHSFTSTTGAPYWFLNYIREFYDEYEYMRVFAGPNNFEKWSFDSSWQYSYEYDSDKYPVHMSIYHPLEDLYSEFEIKY